MQLSIQIVATVDVMAIGVAAETARDVVEGKIFGGQCHGKPYSDLDYVQPGLKVKLISVHSDRRVDAISLDVVSPDGTPSTFYHNGKGGIKKTHTLEEREHITEMEVDWGKYYQRTRVMHIRFTTNRRIYTDYIGEETAFEGYQLGGFKGTSGDNLDSVGAIWTPIEPME
ncbi:hypothetical protein P3T76_009765 [Phytophthora citrophthora]|uniref:Jacalin-type lectin domain-containing protein n=1 Tax=Phytophthora citrophthora TaxID=4793 RepID=A0AAD9GES5_9STRA|nr:hypothetical protein P3T76_009765 [Phytophthora citrophthora]